MQILQKANTTPNKLYQTKSHCELSDLLINSSSSLTHGGYVHDTCSHSKLIKGMKGIGKSSVLQTYVKSTLHPNVVKLYVSCDGVWTPGCHVLQKKNILHVIETALAERGIEVLPRKGNDSLGDNLIRALTKNGLYVLLVLDEFEELYRLSPNDPLNAVLGPQVKASLYALQWLLGQNSGRFLVMLCGSSANCTNLISLSADQIEFPGQAQAAKLNSTKLSPFVVSAPTFTDIEAVHGLLANMGLPCSVKEARMVAFGFGANACNVQRLAQSMKNGGSSSSVSALSRWTLRNKAAVGMSKGESIFLKAVLNRARHENQALLDRLSNKVTKQLDANLIMDDEKWAQEFKPLTRRQLGEVWDELLRQHRDLFAGLNIEHVLLTLRDRNVLQLDEGIMSEHSDQYYPMCLADVFLDSDQEVVDTMHANFSPFYDEFDRTIKVRIARAVKESIA